MIKAVIFDIDDTLAPEKAFVKSGYRSVAAKLVKDMEAIIAFLGKSADTEAIRGQYEDRLWELFCQDSKQVFNRFLAEMGIPEEEVMGLVETYREHVPHPDLYRCYEDVKDTLCTLKRQGRKIGILSDGFLVSQRHKAEAIRKEIGDVFDEILLTDELGREYWKPSSEGFLKLCESLGTAPEEMVYVGDNPKKDFFIHSTLGVHTVRILRPGSVYENAEYLEGIEEEKRIESLRDLITLLPVWEEEI